MKFRLTASVIILSLFLVSFSSAKKNQTTPGYKSQSPAPTLATETLVAGSIPASPTQTITSPNEVTASPEPSLGNFTGTLVNGSGGGIPEGQKVSLVGLDKDQTGSYQKVLELQTPINHDGSYSFTGVKISLNRAFLIVASYQGVEYQSNPVIVTDATTDFSIPVTVYDKANDFNTLIVDQVHLKFDYTSQSAIQVTELFVVTNPGKLVVVVASDGSTIPFLKIPAAAASVQYQLAQGSTQLLTATGGFALLPGADKQYGFLASFSLPYSRSLKYDQLFALPVTSLEVFVPQGMRLSSKQLTAGAAQTIQNQTYLMYQATKMAAGSSLSLALSGKPGSSTGFKFDRQTILWIIIGLVGVLLIGAGMYFYLHDRSLFMKEEQFYLKELEAQEEEIEEGASGEDQESIKEALSALDDLYKTGEIAQEAYDQQQEVLKERLKGISSSEAEKTANQNPDTIIE